MNTVWVIKDPEGWVESVSLHSQGDAWGMAADSEQEAFKLQCEGYTCEQMYLISDIELEAIKSAAAKQAAEAHELFLSEGEG